MGISDFKETVAGASAGLVGTIIGYPLDVMKGFMQAHDGAGMAHAARSIHSAQGIRGFYTGVASPLISLTLLNMTNFSSYAFMSRRIVDLTEGGLTSAFQPSVFIAGAAVGTLASLISTPFELVKIQMQFSARSKAGAKFSGSIAASRHIVREYGVRYMYSGHAINTLREMVFLGTYFFTYEHLKYFFSNTALGSSIGVPLSGGLAGAVGWFVSFPLDCIKTQIQRVDLSAPAASLGGRLPEVKSSFEAYSSLVKGRSVLGLYQGVAPSILRAFVVSSSRFTVYEAVLWAMEA